MKLLRRINNLTQSFFNEIRLLYFKIILKNNLVIGYKAIIKNTSRINVWGNNGKIIIGDSFSMGFNSELYTWDDQLTIGTKTSLNDNCKIYGNVSIGSNCLFASNIFISSGTHNFSYNPYLPIKQQDKLKSVSKRVVIEDDCWLGFGVVVMPGVYIGKGAIIGSNAVVTNDVFPYTINAGIPNRVIGKRLDFNKSFDVINSLTDEHWPFFYKGCNYEQFDNVSTLKDGIEIIDTTSVFLLSKKNTNQLKIKGISNSNIKLNLSLNNYNLEEVFINKGSFDIDLNLVFQPSNSSAIYETLSKDIRDKFSVIVVESFLDNGSVINKDTWRVLSIGYNEN